jgi:hypothetical protein
MISDEPTTPHRVNRKRLHACLHDGADEPLRLRLTALAPDHRRYEGFTDNRKRTHRVHFRTQLQVHEWVKQKLALEPGPVEASAFAPTDR